MELEGFYLVGENFDGIDAGPKGVHCKDIDELRVALTKSPIEKAVVLVKGSRGVGLENIYDCFR